MRHCTSKAAPDYYCIWSYQNFVQKRPGFFRRGVSAYPALDEPVYLASGSDLAKVYARPNAATAQVGTIHQDTIVPAYILTDELLGKHFSIVGR